MLGRRAMRALVGTLILAAAEGQGVTWHSETYTWSASCRGIKIDERTVHDFPTSPSNHCENLNLVNSMNYHHCDMTTDPPTYRMTYYYGCGDCNCAGTPVNNKADWSCVASPGAPIASSSRNTCTWDHAPPPPSLSPPPPHSPAPVTPPIPACQIYKTLAAKVPKCDPPDSGTPWAVDLLDILGPQCSSSFPHACCYQPLGYAGGPPVGTHCSEACGKTHRAGDDDAYCIRTTGNYGNCAHAPN